MVNEYSVHEKSNLTEKGYLRVIDRYVEFLNKNNPNLAYYHIGKGYIVITKTKSNDGYSLDKLPSLYHVCTVNEKSRPFKYSHLTHQPIYEGIKNCNGRYTIRCSKCLRLLSKRIKCLAKLHSLEI